MTVIFWAVFVLVILMALVAVPRKAAPVFVLLLLAVLIAFGAGDA